MNLKRNKTKYGLAKDGTEKCYQRLKEYEDKSDTRILEDTALTIRRTMIGLAIETRDQCNKLAISNYHILLVDRSNVEDMCPIPETLKITQVSENLHPTPNLHSN